MTDLTPQQSVAKYYSRLGSRLGYRLVMKRSQHFGYYDDTHQDEPAAQEKYHQEFAKLLDLKPGMQVLDAGCGQGVVACYLAKNHSVDVTGITIVPHEVESAKKRAREQDVQHRTHFLLADYAAPPCEASSFDRIYTTESLSHAVDVKTVLQALMHLLKPDGILVCAEYEFDYEKFGEEEQWARTFVKQHAAIHGIDQFGLGQFKRTLKNVGFQLIKEIDWTKYVTPSFQRIERIAKPVTAVVRALHLERHFINTTAASMYARGAERGALFYKVYIAAKKQ